MSRKEKQVAKALGANRVIKLPKRKFGGPLEWLALLRLVKRKKT